MVSHCLSSATTSAASATTCGPPTVCKKMPPLKERTMTWRSMKLISVWGGCTLSTFCWFSKRLFWDGWRGLLMNHHQATIPSKQLHQNQAGHEISIIILTVDNVVRHCQINLSKHNKMKQRFGLFFRYRWVFWSIAMHCIKSKLIILYNICSILFKYFHVVHVLTACRWKDMKCIFRASHVVILLLEIVPAYAGRSLTAALRASAISIESWADPKLWG